MNATIIKVTQDARVIKTGFNPVKRMKTMLLTLLFVCVATASAFAVGIQAGVPTNISIGTGTNTAPTLIGYGGRQWAVIGYNGTGVVSATSDMTLLWMSMTGIGSTPFNSTQDISYDGSLLQTAMNNIPTTLSLSDKEVSIVDPVDLVGGAVAGSLSGMAGQDVVGALFWPLSVEEAGQVNLSVRAFGVATDFSNRSWWLRSPGIYTNPVSAAMIFGDGEISGVRSVTTPSFVRPAFRVKLASVIFTSAPGAKSAATVGGAMIPAEATGANTVLKFTFAVSSLTLGIITKTNRTGNTITFNYTGATAGKTLSAAVFGNNGTLKYYGKLADNIAASGSASVTVPDGFLVETDRMQIFVEEANGDNYTDFASEYKELEVLPQASPPTASPASGTAFAMQVAV